MKQKTVRKLRGVLLTLAMVLGLLPGMSLTALADSSSPGVPYLAWDDAEKKLVKKTGENACMEYTVVSADTTTWGESNAEKWYVANGDITISDRVHVEGTANLILCDNAKLTIKKGITVNEGNALNIYAQSLGTGMGMLYAGTADGTDRTCDDNYAGIGSDSEHLGGNITIHGGTITATGGKAAPGIGICTDKSDAVLKVYGGNIKATGGDGNGSDMNPKPGGAGISYIMDPVSGEATITAIGGEGAKNSDGVYVTDGGDGIGGSVNVTGDSPKIEATGGDGSTGVEGSIAGSGIRLRQTYQTDQTDQTVLTALTVSGGSPTITATGGNTTTGRGGKGISIGTNVNSTALKIVSGSPQIISTGGNSKSGKAGDGIYGPITIMTDSETTSVLAIHGEGEDAYAISGATTVSAGFAAFNKKSEDDLWNIDSNIDGSQTTTITREHFVIENKYGRIFKSYCGVVLDQNGGSGIIVDPLYYELGDTLTVPANTYTRNGYCFTGWNTKEDGSGTPYADGAAITLSDGAIELDEFNQLILYAQWEKYPDPVITRSPAVISGLVYNGKGLALITAGEADGGSFLYALGRDLKTPPDDDLYTASIPTAFDAGTYRVWYKVKGDDAHSDSAEDHIDVTVAKADTSITVATGTYNKKVSDAPFDITGISTSNGAAPVFTVTSGKDVISLDRTKVTILKAGTATISVSLPEAKNYKAAANKTITINIAAGSTPDPEVKTSIKNATIKLSKTSLKYSGKAQKPTVKSVTLNGKTLDAKNDYKVSWSNSKSKKLGTYKVTVTGKGNYKDSKTVNYKIVQGKNPLTVKVKKNKLSVTLCKLKKENQTIKRSKYLKVSKGQGKVTYKRAKGNKKIGIDKKTGNITVKKDLKAGSYDVTISVKAAGNKNYKAATKNVTIKIVVK